MSYSVQLHVIYYALLHVSIELDDHHLQPIQGAETGFTDTDILDQPTTSFHNVDMSLVDAKRPSTTSQKIAADAQLIAYNRRDSDSSDSHSHGADRYTDERRHGSDLQSRLRPVADLTPYPSYQVIHELCDNLWV